MSRAVFLPRRVANMDATPEAKVAVELNMMLTQALHLPDKKMPKTARARATVLSARLMQ